MIARRFVSSAVVLAAAVVMLQVSASAQAPDPFTAGWCPRQPFETDFDWGIRCDQEEQRRIKETTDQRVRMAEQQTAETERQRAILEKQPPLPAARNRLLGRWETSTRPAAGGDPFAQLAGMLRGCGVLLGDNIVEFEPTRWAIYDSDGRNDMGAIEYRAGTNGAVFGLPANGSIFQLLPFEFDGPDQVHLVGVVCTLKRTTSTTPGGAASALPPSQTNPAAAAAPASGAAKPAPPTSTRSPLEKFNFRRGYDCPDGQADVVVDSCTSEAPDGTCVVVRVDQPLKNGVPVTFTETVAAFTKRVASCQQRPMMFLNGKLDFAP